MTDAYQFIAEAGHGKAFHEPPKAHQIDIDDDDGHEYRIQAFGRSKTAIREAALSFFDNFVASKHCPAQPYVLCFDAGRYWIEADREGLTSVGVNWLPEYEEYDTYESDASLFPYGIAVD